MIAAPVLAFHRLRKARPTSGHELIAHRTADV
jgi:hypothetical protein